MQDEMAEQEKGHQSKVSELDAQIAEKIEINKQLDSALSTEKARKEQLETERAELLKKYEEEKAAWLESKQKIENRLQYQQG